MNLLIEWTNSLDDQAFKELIVGLNVKKCFYFADESDKMPENNLCEYIKLPTYKDSIYEGLQYCRKNLDICKPLDINVVNTLKPYEMVAFEVINRWRRAIIKDDSYISIKNAYFDYIRFWYSFVIDNEIDCLIQRCTPHQPTSYICYAVCKALNIKVVTRTHTVDIMEGMRFDILSAEIGSPGIRFNEQYTEKLEQYQKSDLSDIILPRYLSKYYEYYGGQENDSLSNAMASLVDSTNMMSRASLYFGRAKKYLRNKHISSLAKKGKHIIAASFRDKKLKSFIERIETIPDAKDKYVLYALHYQPEASTVPGAGLYANQLLVIEMLAKSLPPGYWLYVKEHPVYWDLSDIRESMWEWRDQDFYKRIENIGNVKIIKHNIDNKKLIKESVAVATGVGTIGLEALSEGKNVLVFGGAYYKDAVGVCPVKTKEDCLNAITDIIQGNALKPDEKTIKIYFKTLEKYIFVTGVGDRKITFETEELTGVKDPLHDQVEKIISFIEEMDQPKEITS
ncbi:MAG: hypothetical protein WC961_02150 [Anaerovoracaceae bacterium]